MYMYIHLYYLYMCISNTTNQCLVVNACLAHALREIYFGYEF